MARPAFRDDRAEDGPPRTGDARRPHSRRKRNAARLRAIVGRLEHVFDRGVLALGRSLGGPAGNGQARGVLHVFLLAQRLTERGHHLHQVRPDGVVLYEIARLPSKPLPLTHQPAVRRGERVVVLHFDNQALARMAAAAPSRESVPWQMYRVAARDFAVLAERVRAGELPSDVRAMWGETVVYTALARIGFRTRPAPRTFRTPFVRLFLLGLMAIYGYDGLVRLEHGRLEHFQLGEAWMGLDELQRRFGKHTKGRDRRLQPGTGEHE